MAGHNESRGLVRQLLSVEPEQLVSVIGHLSQNSEKAESLLRPLLTQEALSPSEKREQLHARLAMVSRDVKLVPFVINDLYTAKLSYVAAIRDQLLPYSIELQKDLEAVISDSNALASRRFRAAIVLVGWTNLPRRRVWSDEELELVCQQLVLANTEDQIILRDWLRPLGQDLLGVSRVSSRIRG